MLPDRPIENRAMWRGDELFAQPDVVVPYPPFFRVGSPGGEDPAPEWVARVRDTLERGPGVVLLRGMTLADPGEAGDEDDRDHDTRRFAALAAALGTPLSQTADGDRLLHVRDQRLALADPRRRGPHTNLALGFHTDRCDVIAFACVQPAAEGGENELISSVSLFNEVLHRAPHILEHLGEGMPYLRHTIDPANPRPFTQVPVFTMHQGHFAASYLRVLIDRADRSPDAPTLTDAQRDALDTLDEIAETPDLRVRFKLQRGDVLLLNNWVTLHRRTAFVDSPDPALRRHLMRVWLSMPNSRPLDPRFAEHFGATAAGALRGGIAARAR